MYFADGERAHAQAGRAVLQIVDSATILTPCSYPPLRLKVNVIFNLILWIYWLFIFITKSFGGLPSRVVPYQIALSRGQSAVDTYLLVRIPMLLIKPVPKSHAVLFQVVLSHQMRETHLFPLFESWIFQQAWDDDNVLEQSVYYFGVLPFCANSGAQKKVE